MNHVVASDTASASVSVSVSKGIKRYQRANQYYVVLALMSLAVEAEFEVKTKIVL